MTKMINFNLQYNIVIVYLHGVAILMPRNPHTAEQEK